MFGMISFGLKQINLRWKHPFSGEVSMQAEIRAHLMRLRYEKVAMLATRNLHTAHLLTLTLLFFL